MHRIIPSLPGIGVIASLTLCAAGARAAEPGGIDLPFPFPVSTTLSVPDSASPALLERFRGIRGISVEIRADQANLIPTPLLDFLAGPLAGIDKRVVLRPPFKPAQIAQLKRLTQLEVEVLLGPDALTREDRRQLAALGPVRLVYRMPAGFSTDLWEQVGNAKHALAAIELGPAGLDAARWEVVLQKPRQRRRFVLDSTFPAAGIFPLTRVSPLSLEIRTARNQLPENLLEVLKDLRGVDLCLLVDGRFTREHANPWDRLERFRLKVLVERPGDITPGLASLLARIGPR